MRRVRHAIVMLAAVLGPTLGGCVRGTVPPPFSLADREPAVPAGGAAGRSDDDPLYKSLLGKTPPDRFVGGTWVNSERRLSLAALRGNVVVLAFAFLKCGACADLVLRLVEWEEKHAPQGLTVVYVDNGRADALSALEAAGGDQGLPFAMFHDRLGHMLFAYGVRAFPTVYVIGRGGEVVWEGVVTGAEDDAERAIEAALR